MGTADIERSIKEPGRSVRTVGSGFGRLRLWVIEETCTPSLFESDSAQMMSVKRIGKNEMDRRQKRERPRPDSNRGITVLQTAALPLGYEAELGVSRAIPARFFSVTHRLCLVVIDTREVYRFAHVPESPERSQKAIWSSLTPHASRGRRSETAPTTSASGLAELTANSHASSVMAGHRG